MKLKKVVHIVQCHVDLEREQGGVANVVRALVLGSSDLGLSSVLYCGNRELGVKRSEPGTHKTGLWITQRILGQARHRAFGPTEELLQALAQEEGPYVAHVHGCFSAMTEAAMAFLTQRNIPFIFTPHGKLSPGLFGRRSTYKKVWLGLFTRKWVNRADRIVLGSTAEAALFPQLGILKEFQVIPNGYHPFPVPSQKKGPGDTILFLGYLDPRKQPELLVKAYALSKARERFTLTLAGPDAYGHLARVKAEIKKTGLEDRILLPGPVYGEAKQELFARAACFVLPSTGEGMPVTPLEALGAGLPLILSKECNLPEAARAGAAIELEDFEPARWAGALDEVLLESDLRDDMAESAAQLGKEYTWPRVVERWVSLYEEMLAGKPQPAGATR